MAPSSPDLPKRGDLVFLRPELTEDGGEYTVVSVRATYVKVKRGNRSPIELSLARFFELHTSGGAEQGYGEGV